MLRFCTRRLACVTAPVSRAVIFSRRQLYARPATRFRVVPAARFSTRSPLDQDVFQTPELEAELEDVEPALDDPNTVQPASTHRTQNNAVVQASLTEITADHEFAALGLSPRVLLALRSMKVLSPTQIQSLAVPAILSGEDCLLAAQTGTGKTLSYLAPIVHLLARDELEPGFTARIGRPRAIVVVPSRELAMQVVAVAKALSHHAKFKPRLATTGTLKRVEKKQLAQTIDLLVATPGRLQDLIEKEQIFLTDTKYVILDEADTLLNPDQGFLELIQNLLLPIRARVDAVSRGKLKQLPGKRQHVDSAQFVCVGASFTSDMKRVVSHEFPDMLPIEQSLVHRTLQGCLQEFVQIKDADKLEVLAEVLTNQRNSYHEHMLQQGETLENTQVFPTVIFCNTLDSCRAVYFALQEQGFSVLDYHGGIPGRMRVDHWKRFLKREYPILITTDIASRGLDTDFVRHVINFDFPLNPVDYIHRVGRTARNGTTGVATSLLDKRDTVLAQGIQTANSGGHAIQNLSSDKMKYGDPSRKGNRAPKPAPQYPRDAKGNKIYVAIDNNRRGRKTRVNDWLPPHEYQAYKHRQEQKRHGQSNRQIKDDLKKRDSDTATKAKNRARKIQYKRSKRQARASRAVNKFKSEQSMNKPHRKFK